MNWLQDEIFDDKATLVKEELCLKLASYIVERIELPEIDLDDIADTESTKLVHEIAKIVRNDRLSDFEMIDEIVTILHTYGINTGRTHDF